MTNLAAVAKIKCILAVIALAIVLGLIFYFTTKRDINHKFVVLKNAEQVHLEIGFRSMGHEVETIRQDLLFFSEAPGVLDVLAHPGDSARLQQFQNGLIRFSASRRCYDQLRYLDKGGMEIIRVNSAGGKPHVVLPEELQDKAQRYYFSDAIGLEKGQIYFSPLDLNIENGAIEEPYKPVLRAATPVFTQDNEKRGILIFNYSARILFDLFRTSFSGHEGCEKCYIQGRPMILNQNSFWLLAPDREDEWGFMLEHKRSFGQRFPLVWQQIKEQDSGRIMGADGLFTFVKFYPLGDVKPSGDNGQYFWVLLSQVPEAELAMITSVVRHFPWFLYFSILVISLPVFCLLSFLVRQNKASFAQLAQQEKRFRFLYDKAPMPYQSLDENGCFLDVNSAWLESLGYDRDEVIGRSFADFLIPEEKPLFETSFASFKERGEVSAVEFELVKKNQTTLLVSFNGKIACDSQGRFIQTSCIFQDISELRLQEEKISHLNLVLQTISKVNQLIIVEKKITDLIESICDILVANRGYHSAWIVLVDDKGAAIKTAHAGLPHVFSKLDKDLRAGKMPSCVSQAAEKRGLAVFHDPVRLCQDCPLKDGYRNAGVMAEVLVYDDRIYGFLVVSLPAVLLDESDERELFSEVAADLAYGLFSQEQEDKREEAEQGLRQHEQELLFRDRLSRVFLASRNDALYRDVLDVVLERLKSPLGVFGYMENPDLLVCPSMSHEIWDQCAMEHKTFSFPRKTWTGIWKDALVEGKTYYKNKPVNVPKGHFPVSRSMATGIVFQNQVIGFLQVGNKETDYDEADRFNLENQADFIAPILKARLERERAAKLLAESENHLLEAQRIALIGHYIYDVKKDVLTFSDTMQVLFDITPGRTESNYERFLAKVHPEDREAVNEVFLEVIKNKTSTEITYRVLSARGKIRYLHHKVIVHHDKEKNQVGLMGTIQDVSERKKMEERLLQSEKMTTIAGLAAGVAHEINTPLSGIMQSMQIIEEGLNPEEKRNREVAEEIGFDLEKMREYFKRQDLAFFMDGIGTSAARAAEIINNLLQFSRPRKVETVVVSPAEILDAAVALSLADYDLKKKYDIDNIEIVREYDPQLKSISCVAMEIEQVILNLLRNAAQALAAREDRAHQARIVLRTGKVNGKARIEVEDNGPGMDEETRLHVFDPFFTTKEVGEGTGLGLSVSHTIICDKHQGRMWVESEPGRGAIFIIELPYC